jgi:hypothetical protein
MRDLKSGSSSGQRPDAFMFAICAARTAAAFSIGARLGDPRRVAKAKAAKERGSVVKAKAAGVILPF